MEAFPNTIFTDSIGASETGFQGMGLQDNENINGDGPVVALGPEQRGARTSNQILDPETSVGVTGRLGRGGSVPVGYYKDPEKSAKTFIEIDGERYSVPGDFARIEEGGRVTLLGRGSNCVNTGGEKVYPEEVEMAIKGHPAVYDVLVVGVPDEKFGQAVAAVVQPREGTTPELEDLRTFLRSNLSGYKLPRSLTLVAGDPAQRHRQGAVPQGQGARLHLGRRSMMRTPICDAFGIEYPIFAFTPSEQVAAAVSRAGGLGVLGCVRFNDPDELDQTLTWLDDNTDGKPYGVDVVMPMKIPTEGTSVDLKAMIPQEHITFVDATLQKLGVPPLPEGEGREGVLGWLHSVARSHVDVALKHRPVLIANALGSPPVDVIEKAHEHGVKVAALAGAAKHALSHVANGVDIIVAQGYEAGGHTGEIARMVLTPEIVDAVGPDVPVLGAGGIGSAARSPPRWRSAPRACGPARSGSPWRSTNLSAGIGIRDAFLRAGSSDTVRTRIYTGKPARLLKTRWTEAWEAEDAPAPLPMPLQNLLVADAHNRMNRGDDPDTISMPVGQIVGRMNEVRPVAEVIAELVAEFEETASGWTVVRGLRSSLGPREALLAFLANRRERATHGDAHTVVHAAPGSPARGRAGLAGSRRGPAGGGQPALGHGQQPSRRPRPQADCGPGARPETDIQGRVPSADYASGRVDARATAATPGRSPTRAAPAGSRCSATATAGATSARSTTRRCCSPRTCCSTPPRASASSCST